ncbi:uncharacterized protein LOC113780955 [Coffea eugenioides]|uniref:uncharacterized protein LOC113780955 n=1 Tax=Coffea eugenioides TaxID=49369 RepID=UPI000F60C0B5|nr:uncharacterized protein LOC113780955 [Coffea eugenioides]
MLTMDSQLENHEPMLRESIKHFLASYRNGNSDFSPFEAIFFRLIQKMLDPPLEITWFYSAVTFHSSKESTTPDSTSNRMMLLVKDLFQLLVSSSSLSNGWKRTALLAPVVFRLYDIVRDSLTNGFPLREEIEDLLEKIVSYISVCCCHDVEKGNYSDLPMVCFEDLVRVWTVDRVDEGCDYRDNLRVFFPVLSDEVRGGVDRRSGIECLAGIVLCEVFWLRLCLKFNQGIRRDELEMDMRNWVVQTINGFENIYFLDMLLRMLLEPSLPIANLLSSDDAMSLMKVLYDAVLIVDYSCLNSRGWMQLCDNQFGNLALMWLLVADDAVQFARDICDHSRALSYVNSFNESHLSNQLIKWISNQACMEDGLTHDIGTPRDLIRWLLVLEDQGLGVFYHNLSRFLTKTKLETIITWKSILSCSGNLGKREYKVNMDEEMADPSCRADPASIVTHEASIEGTRKRKDGMREEVETRVKHVKYNLHETSIYKDKFGSGVDMCNPVCDEDMEVMVTG